MSEFPSHDDSFENRTLHHLTPLQLPVPLNLASVFGYPGDARYVGFSWTPLGDEVFYDDGRLSGTGASHLFLLYRRHPTVASELQGYNLGHSDVEATHQLIVDSELDRAHIAETHTASSFLSQQYGPPPQLTPFELEELRRDVQELFNEQGNQGWREVQIDPQIIAKQLQAERQMHQELLQFLNEWTPSHDQESEPGE